jgi:hypothetical protein
MVERHCTSCLPSHGDRALEYWDNTVKTALFAGPQLGYGWIQLR